MKILKKEYKIILKFKNSATLCFAGNHADSNDETCFILAGQTNNN